MTPLKIRNPTLASLTLILSLALQACGGSGGGAQTNSSDSSTAAALTLASSSSSSSSSSGGATPTNADVVVQVDASMSGPEVNRLILGTNVEWVDSGDNLLLWDTPASCCS